MDEGGQDKDVKLEDDSIDIDDDVATSEQLSYQQDSSMLNQSISDLAEMDPELYGLRRSGRANVSMPSGKVIQS